MKFDPSCPKCPCTTGNTTREAAGVKKAGFNELKGETVSQKLRNLRSQCEDIFSEIISSDNKAAIMPELRKFEKMLVDVNLRLYADNEND